MKDLQIQMPKQELGSRVLDFIRNYAIIFMLLILIVVVSIIEPKFLTLGNFRNILNQISVIGVLACGMTFVIIIGCIDLSVGSVISVASVAVLMSMARVGDVWAMLIAVAIGAGIGFFNGSVISLVNGKLGQSFMVTYGSQTVFAALALILSGGLFIMSQSAGVFSQIGRNLNPVYVFIILVAACQIFITKTTFGRKIYFLGSNSECANLSGINIRLYRTLVFVLCGAIAALAGVLLTSRVASANPNAGVGYELDAIAAVVVGGVSMRGGSGNFLNTIIGVIVIGVLSNTLNLLGVTSYPQMIVKGIVIALAVGFDVWNKSRQQVRLV